LQQALLLQKSISIGISFIAYLIEKK